MKITEPELEKYLEKELTILKAIDHPNLMSYIGACRDDKKKHNVYLVTELCNGGGSINKFLHVYVSSSVFRPSPVLGK